MWEQNLGMLCLWRDLTAQYILASKQGLGKTDNHPVTIMTKGSSRCLTTPAKQVWPSQLSNLGEVKKLAAWEVNGSAGIQNDAGLVPKPTMFFSLGTLPV